MAIKVEVDPSGVVRDTLKQIKELGGNLAVPFTLIAKSWFKSNKSIFTLKSKGQYDDLSQKPFFAFWETGHLYKFFKGGYKEYKQEKYGSAYPILKATGALEKSITDASDVNSINLIVNKTALYLGSRIPYGIYHQSPDTRTKIPFRPFVLLGVEQVATSEQKLFSARVINILQDYYGQIVSKSYGSKPPGAV